MKWSYARLAGRRWIANTVGVPFGDGRFTPLDSFAIFLAPDLL